MATNQNITFKACYWTSSFLPVKWPGDLKCSFHLFSYLITHNRQSVTQKRKVCFRPQEQEDRTHISSALIHIWAQVFSCHSFFSWPITPKRPKKPETCPWPPAPTRGSITVELRADLCKTQGLTGTRCQAQTLGSIGPRKMTSTFITQGFLLWEGDSKVCPPNAQSLHTESLPFLLALAQDPKSQRKYLIIAM